MKWIVRWACITLAFYSGKILHEIALNDIQYIFLSVIILVGLFQIQEQMK